MTRRPTTATAPHVSPLWMHWFGAYAERYVRRHFHSVRVLNGPPPISSNPLVIYLNHAAWWDPMICLLLRNRYFIHRNSFAPIDANALGKYKFFSRLGFFPVEKNTLRGTIQFLSTATAILRQRDSALWLTPQGDFVDVRTRPANFRVGLGHLAQRTPVATYVPLAIEYNFWQERLPEACVSFGAPLILTKAEATDRGVKQMLNDFERRLEHTQDELAGAVKARDAMKLRPLTCRPTGVGGVYDLWRKARGFVSGKSFHLEHAHK